MTNSEQSAAPSVTLPLVFTYNGTILGAGFVADIKMRGRLLACHEVGGAWLYGVNPGAIAIGAANLEVANKSLRHDLTALFIDFAQQAPTFAAFEATIDTYFNESDAGSQQAWQDAVKRVRAGSVSVPDGLPIEKADDDCFVKITAKPIEAVTPQDNLAAQQQPTPGLAAAA